LIDSFGRGYATDLTQTFDNRGLSLTNLLFVDNNVGFSPFAMAIQGPTGTLKISGLGMTTTTPAMLSGMFLTSDRKETQVRQLLVDAPINDTTTLNLGYNVDSMSGLIN